MTPPLKSHTSRAGLPRRGSEFVAERFSHQRHAPVRTKEKPLRVLKFGGTSVGDAPCMERVVEIVRASAVESEVVVVVSAMSGVTNKLVAAASRSEAGDEKAAAAIFEELRSQHISTANVLIHAAVERDRFEPKMEELFAAGTRLCEGTALLGELTPRTRDAISSLGERLSVLLVAAALAERGLASQAIEATELVVTDASHGAADPCMDQTRRRCEARLRPVLRQGIIPVVTGFIGATADGVLTTLGRGGSDYSATILGAALEANEVVIWTDVDGMQTADPRLVPGARTLPEVSYREAAELAYFGAKVLHPKTLRPLMHSSIPLWIRNTFAPERPGTKITRAEQTDDAGVKALAALSDVAMIAIASPTLAGLPDALSRALRATAAVQADVLLVSQAASQKDLRLVIPSALAERTMESLRREFVHDLANESSGHIVLDADVALVTIVGRNMRSISEAWRGAFRALAAENVNVIAITPGSAQAWLHGSSQGSSHGSPQRSAECTMSFVVAKKDANAAILILHRDLDLADSGPHSFDPDVRSSQPYYPVQTSQSSGQKA
jgi:bifunctional aspartokinase / homoserine dehydrogenase 1